MSRLLNAISEQQNKTLTENGAVAYATTTNACLDLFQAIGSTSATIKKRDYHFTDSASGADLINLFIKAFDENEDQAIRIMLWSRDVLEGSKRRAPIKFILKHLADTDRIDILSKIVSIVRSIGRWDDIFLLVVHANKRASKIVLQEISKNIRTDNLLCKWLPRKGEVANVVRAYLKMTPKEYRSLVVSNTKVVEQMMSMNQWGAIEFSKIPGQALSNYMKAFERNTPMTFREWVGNLTIDDVKVGTMYPHQITEKVSSWDSSFYQIKIADMMWKALPNYLNDANVLAVVDVSGSMNTPAGGQESVTAMHISQTLGLYVAERTGGIFKDHVISFHELPSLVKISGCSLMEKYRAIGNIDWGASTDFEAVAKLIAKTAKNAYLMQEELPTHVIVFSDMQFDHAKSHKNNDKTFDQIWKREFEKRGYQAPILVFWNLADRSGVSHTKAETEGFVAVGGYSVNTLADIFKEPVDCSDCVNEALPTPKEIMERVIMKDRYNWNGV